MNEGKRDVLIFPKFKNIDKLQDIRIKYDSLANIVPPHITLAFPFGDNISNEDKSKSDLGDDYNEIVLIPNSSRIIKLCTITTL